MMLCSESDDEYIFDFNMIKKKIENDSFEDLDEFGSCVMQTIKNIEVKKLNKNLVFQLTIILTLANLNI